MLDVIRRRLFAHDLREDHQSLLQLVRLDQRAVDRSRAICNSAYLFGPALEPGIGRTHDSWCWFG